MMIIVIVAILALASVGVLGAWLVVRMKHLEQLQERYEMLKSCHDEHYQAMLYAGRKWADCEDTLSGLGDALVELQRQEAGRRNDNL